MGSRWRKAKAVLGLNLCVYVPRSLDEDGAPSPGERSSSCASQSSATLMPTTPIPSSSGLRLSKFSSRSFPEKTCAICLGTMKLGQGHALFTAECSHTFHFHCITSNVKYGNHVCPVCRFKWKEIPLQGPPSDLPHRRARVNPVIWPQDDGQMTVLRRLPRANSRRGQRLEPLFHSSEPNVFDDDEPSEISFEDEQPQNSHDCHLGTVDIKTYPESSAIPQSACTDNFTILIHLRAPLASATVSCNSSLTGTAQNSRAPVDLVTVLDVSGSMAGTKLALLKRAMGFVIQNLGPSDRLSVIAFSSSARRLFRLRHMSESGRQQALQAVSSLMSSGGTNIAEGLRKAAKVVDERREKNSICSIMLLSDGQDTYTISTGNSRAQHEQPEYQLFAPSAILGSTGHKVPVHTFGFGSDHDSALMHSISEISGGTFSFIEAESVIQDAFAQCIGGLLSVVVQEMHIEVECVHPEVHLGSVKSGSYPNRISADRRTGSIKVGDLYADEERNFLVSVTVPTASEEILLLKVGCSYKDPVSKEIIHIEGREVKILRPEFAISQMVSIEVDRQRSRMRAAEAMGEARSAAERGNLDEAVSILEDCRRTLLESHGGRGGDALCVALIAELHEMQERMTDWQRYEASGRAYVLSGLSSHSWQRATTRGDSTESATLFHAYQTPSMVEMLQRSQTFGPATSRPKPPIQPSKSFPARPQPQ